MKTDVFYKQSKYLKSACENATKLINRIMSELTLPDWLLTLNFQSANCYHRIYMTLVITVVWLFAVRKILESCSLKQIYDWSYVNIYEETIKFYIFMHDHTFLWRLFLSAMMIAVDKYTMLVSCICLWSYTYICCLHYSKLECSLFIPYAEYTDSNPRQSIPPYIWTEGTDTAWPDCQATYWR